MEKQQKELKLNIGCGGRPLPGFINIDADDLEMIKARYPNQHYSDDLEVYNYDVLNFPLDNGVVDEIRADSFIEHLSFSQEPLFFNEIKRILKPGGFFKFSVPDFDEVIKLWISAKDDWKDFFRNDEEAISQQHWFGEYSYAMDNKWGYLTAIIFGNQNGDGQFHKNCYTIPKIRAILKHIEFAEIEINTFKWQGDRDPMIGVTAQKS